MRTLGQRSRLRSHSIPSRAVQLLALLACVSCKEQEFDHIGICFPPASGRIVVEVRVTCAGDHRGAELDCSVDVEGSDVHVTATGHDGKDPNDGCSVPLTATCETDALPDGLYSVFFEDDSFEVPVPNPDGSFCEDD
jgi:hypothetical protein